MSFINTASINKTLIIPNLGFSAGDPNNLILSAGVPQEYIDTITKFEVEVGYHFNFDYVGWGNHAFKYTQVLNVAFQRPDAIYGTSILQMDTGNSKVSTFNSQKDTVLSFNPNNVDTATYPTLKASHRASIDLMGVNFIDGGVGTVFTLRDLIRRQGSLIIGGYPESFVRTSSCPFTNINQILATYYANISIHSSVPII